MKHILTPWKVLEGYNCFFIEEKDSLPAPINVIAKLEWHGNYSPQKENAAFIVKACNEYQGLVDAIDQAKNLILKGQVDSAYIVLNRIKTGEKP